MLKRSPFCRPDERLIATMAWAHLTPREPYAGNAMPVRGPTVCADLSCRLTPLDFLRLRLPMKTLTGQRMRTLLMHLDHLSFRPPPSSVGRRTTRLAMQNDLIEVIGDLSLAYRCRLTEKGLAARFDLARDSRPS